MKPPERRIRATHQWHSMCGFLAWDIGRFGACFDQSHVSAVSREDKMHATDHRVASLLALPLTPNTENAAQAGEEATGPRVFSSPSPSPTATDPGGRVSLSCLRALRQDTKGQSGQEKTARARQPSSFLSLPTDSTAQSS